MINNFKKERNWDRFWQGYLTVDQMFLEKNIIGLYQSIMITKLNDYS